MRAEGVSKDIEVFAVARGDGDVDVNGAADVGDAAVESAGEESADLVGRELFEGERDSVLK